MSFGVDLSMHDARRAYHFAECSKLMRGVARGDVISASDLQRVVFPPPPSRKPYIEYARDIRKGPKYEAANPVEGALWTGYQWIVTKDGVEARPGIKGSYDYWIDRDRLWEDEDEKYGCWISHMWEKEWVVLSDFAEALRLARKLLKVRRRKRQAISARLRFEIFKRDAFRCVYCLSGPHNGFPLHVDHKIAVANGGKSVADNLVTACEPCNLGKGARALDN